MLQLHASDLRQFELWRIGRGVISEFEPIQKSASSEKRGKRHFRAKTSLNSFDPSHDVDRNRMEVQRSEVSRDSISFFRFTFFDGKPQGPSNLRVKDTTRSATINQSFHRLTRRRVLCWIRYADFQRRTPIYLYLSVFDGISFAREYQVATPRTMPKTEAS